MNFKILVYYYFKNKTNKAKQSTARQTTNQRSSNATIPRNCNQFEVLQRQTLSFKAAIVTSLIDLSALVLN